MSDVLPDPARGPHGIASAPARTLGAAGIGRGSSDRARPCGPGDRAQNPDEAYEDRT